MQMREGGRVTADAPALRFSDECGDHHIKNIDDLFDYLCKIKETAEENARKLVCQLLWDKNFPRFMGMLFQQRVLDSNSSIVIIFQGAMNQVAYTFRKLNAAQRARKFEEFIGPYIDCPLVFDNLFHAPFFHTLIYSFDIELNAALLSAIAKTSNVSHKLLTLYLYMLQSLDEAKLKTAEKMFETVMETFPAWENAVRLREVAGVSVESEEADFCRDLLVKIISLLPQDQARNLLQRVVDSDVAWQQIMQSKRSIVFLLGRFKGKCDDILINKLFAGDAVEWNKYLSKENISPQYSDYRDGASTSTLKFKVFMTELTPNQRTLILQKLRERGISLSAIAASYQRLESEVLAFLSMGDDPTLIPSGREQDTLAFFLQSRNNNWDNGNEFLVVEHLLEAGCDLSHPAANMESFIANCAAKKPQYIPMLLSYGVFFEDAKKILHIMVENKTLTLDIYKAMLRYIHFDALVYYDFPDHYAEIHQFAMQIMQANAATSVTEMKLALAPTKQETDPIAATVSKNTFFTLCMMYAMVNDQEKKYHFLFSQTKDILMMIVSFCAPEFDLKAGRQLLELCVEQKAYLKEMVAYSQPIHVVQSVRGQSFRLFVPAEKLMKNYVDLKKKGASEEELVTYREKAIPHVLRHISIYRNPGFNTAVMNRIVDMELMMDAGELLNRGVP